MSLHQTDLIQCQKLPGTTTGLLCARCDGKCPTCESFITATGENGKSTRTTHIVKICDDCSFGSASGKCILCGAKGVSEAWYCRECVLLEKDRDGCPKVMNVGTTRADLFYERRKGVANNR